MNSKLFFLALSASTSILSTPPEKARRSPWGKVIALGRASAVANKLIWVPDRKDLALGFQILAQIPSRPGRHFPTDGEIDAVEALMALRKFVPASPQKNTDLNWQGFNAK